MSLLYSSNSKVLRILGTVFSLGQHIGLSNLLLRHFLFFMAAVFS